MIDAVEQFSRQSEALEDESAAKPCRSTVTENPQPCLPTFIMIMLKLSK